MFKNFRLRLNNYNTTICEKTMQGSVEFKLLKLLPPDKYWGTKMALKFNIEL